MRHNRSYKYPDRSELPLVTVPNQDPPAPAGNMEIGAAQPSALIVNTQQHRIDTAPSTFDRDLDQSKPILVFNDAYRFYCEGQLSHTFTDVLQEFLPVVCESCPSQ